MKRLIVISSILLLMGCAGHQGVKQDINPGQSVTSLPALLTQAADSVYRICAVATYKAIDDQTEGRELPAQLGNAFAINSRQLLTVKHVVETTSYPVFTPFGTHMVFVSPEDIAKTEVWLLLDDGSRILTNIIYKADDLDFAVLEVDEPLPFPNYSIGNSDNSQILDKIFIISNFGIGENIRSGRIARLDFGVRIDYGVYEYDTNRFCAQIPIEDGDSGAPMFLFHDGRLEVGGLISETTTGSQGISTIVKINLGMNRFRSWQNEREL